jgi:hypothetical protein
VDAATHLVAEHVVDELVLGDPAQPGERAGLDDRLEMLAIAANFSSRARYPGLDPLLQFIGSNAHERKRSGSRPDAILNEA